MFKKKSRMITGAAVFVLSTGLLVSCGQKETAGTEAKQSVAEMVTEEVGVKALEENRVKTGDEKYKIVCTTFPQYDWVMQVLGERKDVFDVTLLLDDGVDLHSYQPTAEDIAKIVACDCFIYVGGESDEWVEDALKEATNTNMQVINLLDALGERVKEEEIVEGMEHNHEHEHDEHEHDEYEHDKHEHDEHENDEHVWLSLTNAQILCGGIADRFAIIDPENEEVYKANAAEYIDELAGLDTQYKEVVEKSEAKAVVFGDRFPFRYLMDDYDLEYYAAFAGCSAETEASFETVVFLAEKVDELGLDSVFVIEDSNQELAETIVQNTKEKSQKIFVLDSLQSVTREDMENGVTYLSIMQDNLEVLKEAL